MTAQSVVVLAKKYLTLTDDLLTVRHDLFQLDLLILLNED
jgi:hypothetical protein